MVTASQCVMKMWWTRPGTKGAQDSRYRSSISEKMLPHCPSPWAISLRDQCEAAGEESIHHVTHTAVHSNPNGAGFLNLTQPHSTNIITLSVSLVQPPYTKVTLRTSSSLSQQGCEHVHRLYPQGQRKDERRELRCFDQRTKTAFKHIQL